MMQAQSFQVKQGDNMLADGSVLHISDASTNLFGRVMIDSHLKMINLTSQEKEFTMELTIVSIPQNTSFQFCFGSCTMPSAIGTVKLDYTMGANGELNENILEFFPEKEVYSSAQTKLKIYETANPASAIEITIYFDYTDPSGLISLDDSKQAVHIYNDNSSLCVDYNFQADAVRTVSCYSITGSAIDRKSVV